MPAPLRKLTFADMQLSRQRRTAFASQNALYCRNLELPVENSSFSFWHRAPLSLFLCLIFGVHSTHSDPDCSFQRHPMIAEATSVMPILRRTKLARTRPQPA